MVVLCCPQCRTRLPVNPEKLGKSLFVCPSCTFPLEASNAVADDAAPGSNGPGLFPYSLKEPVSPPAVPARIPKSRPDRTIPDAPAAGGGAAAAGQAWIIGGLAAGALVFLTGLLFLALLGRRAAPPEDSPTSGDEVVVAPTDPETEPDPEAAAEVESPADLLDVLALGKLLKEEDKETRNKAALALAKAGPESKAAFPALLEGLKDEDETFRNLVRNALDQAGPPDPEDFPAVSLGLRDEDPDVRAYAVAALEFMGEDAWGEIDQVRELTEDEDPHVCAAAKKTLEQLEKALLESLTKKLLDSKPDVRAEAARGLGDLGEASRGATSALVEVLADENDAVRVAAREALAQMGEEVVPVLAEAMTNNRNLVARRAAVGTLAQMGEDAIDAIPALANLAEDPAIGAEVGNALEGFGELAVPVLAARVVVVPTEVRRDVYRTVLIRIGSRGTTALNTYISRHVHVTNHFTTVINKVGPAPAPIPVTPPPAGGGGNIYKHLVSDFAKWDQNKTGKLQFAELMRMCNGNEKAARDLLKRYDRDGKGYLTRHDHQHWAKHFATNTHKAQEARDKVKNAHTRLDKQVKTSTKQDQTKAAATLTRLREEAKKQPAGKAGPYAGKTPNVGKRPSGGKSPPVVGKKDGGKGPAGGKTPPGAKGQGNYQRQVAVASMQAQRRKDQTQHRQAQVDLQRRLKEARRIERKQGAIGKNATPAAYRPARAQKVAYKPPTRVAPPPPRYQPQMLAPRIGFGRRR